MNKQDLLLKRYYKTSKGCKIINVIATSPTLVYDEIYRAGKVYYRVGDKLLNRKEFFLWCEEQQHLHRKQAMEKYGLTESDMVISEENINKIEQDEIRNVGIFGEDKEELRHVIVDVSTPKIRPI